MGDPLSLTASLIAVGGLAIQVGKGVRKFYKAPDELIALGNEVTDLRALFKQLEILCKRPWGLEQADYLRRAERLLDESIKPGLLRLQKMFDKNSLQSSIQTVKRSSWVMIEHKVNRERNSLRSAKQDLMEIVQMLSASATRHIDFELGEIILDMEKSKDEHRNRHAEILRHVALVEDHVQRQAFTAQRMESTFSELRLDMGSLEATSLANQTAILGQLASMQRGLTMGPVGQRESSQGDTAAPSTDASDAVANTTAKNSSSITGISCVINGKELGCSSWCGCRCHQRQNISTPLLVDRFVGRLLVGTSVLPWMRPTCDNPACRQSRRSEFRIRYDFPSWFLRYSVNAHASSSTKNGPELVLRVPRIRSYKEQIFERVVNGDIDFVKGAFQTGLASLYDIEDLGGHTLLHKALSAKQPAMCSFLLSQGADIDTVNHKQNSSGDIFWTIVLSKGLPEDSYQSLIAGFSNATYVEEGQFTSLHRTIFKQSKFTLEDLLLDSTKLINHQDAYGRTPLAWAASRADLESVDTLLRYGADPNIVEKGGWGPLHNSMLTTDPRISMRLLDGGADPNLTSGIVKDTPLHIACRGPALVCHIPSLLQKSADPSLRTTRLETALEFATRLDLAEGVKMLVEATPKIYHIKAIIRAYHHEALKALTALLDHNATCWNGVDDDGRTVLHHAAMAASVHVLGVLSLHDFTSISTRRDKSGKIAAEIAAAQDRGLEWTEAWNHLMVVRERTFNTSSGKWSDGDEGTGDTDSDGGEFQDAVEGL